MALGQREEFYVPVSKTECGPNPQAAPFSDDRYINWESFISPDGKRMFFASNRPPSSGMDIWMVERTSDASWSAPIRLPDPINSAAQDGSPCVTNNGTLYFKSLRTGGTGGSWLYRAIPKDGAYAQDRVVWGISSRRLREKRSRSCLRMRVTSYSLPKHVRAGTGDGIYGSVFVRKMDPGLNLSILDQQSIPLRMNTDPVYPRMGNICYSPGKRGVKAWISTGSPLQPSESSNLGLSKAEVKEAESEVTSL